MDALTHEFLQPVEAKYPSYVEHASGVNLEMVWVPNGAFRMGSAMPVDETVRRYGGRRDYFENEYPLHTVTVDGFWMGRTPVTNAQYRQFCPNHSSLAHEGLDLDQDDQPVVRVSWEDASKFCAWLSHEGNCQYALPTEAQWEYACRAGTETVRYWGDDDERMGLYANVRDKTAQRLLAALPPIPTWAGNIFVDTEDGFAVTSPVGRFLPNGFGLRDMLGNVFEWCADFYGRDYYAASPRYNPVGPEEGFDRVLRGGAWGSCPSVCRAAYRDWCFPSRRAPALGFRVVRACDYEFIRMS